MPVVSGRLVNLLLQQSFVVFDVYSPYWKLIVKKLDTELMISILCYITTENTNFVLRRKQ